MTAVTKGTATETTLFSVKNEDMVRDLQNVAFDLKFGIATLPSTTSELTAHTVNIKEEFGMDRVLGILGNAHTTEDSVIVTEAPTTIVNNGVLEIRVPASNDNVKRVYLIIGV